MKIEFDHRTPVLLAALNLESHLSEFLQQILGIDAEKETYCFGNTGKAFALNHKVNILLDMDILPKEDQWKLILFMEVRNQCVHNAGANTFEEIFKLTTIKGKKLIEEYPEAQKETTEELKLKTGVGELCKDTFIIVNKVMKGVVEKNIMDHQLKVQNEFYNGLINLWRNWEKEPNTQMNLQTFNDKFVESMKEMIENPPPGLKEKAAEHAAKIMKE